jgi:1-acyl-sn-glycerol-3-phosphate acyltransferase
MLNQTSLIETFTVHYVLPTSFKIFMNIEYALIPFVGWLPWLMGGVVIIRQWSKQARKGLEKAAQRIRNGNSFYMSIEGVRSPAAGLNPYKKGSAILAISAQTTIIPIVIYDARKILPYGEWRVKGGNVEIVLCQAIPTTGLKYEDRDELTRRLRSIAEIELYRMKTDRPLPSAGEGMGYNEDIKGEGVKDGTH